MNAESSVQRCPGCFEPAGALPVCERCGYDRSAPRDPLYLPHGHRLAEQYEVGRVLGKPGGFGITYLGWDIHLERRVAIKEYLPKKIAARADNGLDVTVADPADQERFDFGRQEFLAEARTVARFDHPSVVRVGNYFTAHNTAYLVMEYYPGVNLADHLAENENRVDAQTAIGILRPILDGLQRIHDSGYLHRDVKPANIHLTSFGRPILLDFGAARQATSARKEGVSVVLTDGYAPLEQYQQQGRQGPWTDVYGAAATLYRLITGEVPLMAMDRIGADPLEQIEKRLNLPAELADILRRAMAIHVESRTATARQFANELESFLAGEAGPQSIADEDPLPAPKPEAEPIRVQINRAMRRSDERWPWYLLPFALALAVLVWHWPAAGPGWDTVMLTPTEPDGRWSRPREQASVPAARAPADGEQAGALMPPLEFIPASGHRHAGRALTVPAYQISLRPVQVGEFRRFVEEREYRNPRWGSTRCANPNQSELANWQAPGRPQAETSPVVCVDWFDARAYADWLSERSGRRFRLPTATEWALAARRFAPPQQLPQSGEGPAELREWTCSVRNGDPNTPLYCAGEISERPVLTLDTRSAGVTPLSPQWRASDLGFRLVAEVPRR